MPASATRNYSGYRVLNRDELLTLLAADGVPPAYPRLVAEHVTHRYPDADAAPRPTRVEVVGHACADGVQALLVAVDGSTRRPDGGRYHLTYSLADGRKPVASNDLLATAPILPVGPYALDVEAF